LNSIDASRDKKTGRFLTGNNGGGRPKGSRNKLASEFIDALANDFTEHGASAIERVRKEKPDVYLRVVASILPSQLDVAISNVNIFAEVDVSDAAEFNAAFELASKVIGLEQPTAIDITPQNETETAGVPIEPAQ
jgi:hypothetical protein